MIRIQGAELSLVDDDPNERRLVLRWPSDNKVDDIEIEVYRVPRGWYARGFLTMFDRVPTTWGTGRLYPTRDEAAAGMVEFLEEALRLAVATLAGYELADPCVLMRAAADEAIGPPVKGEDERERARRRCEWKRGKHWRGFRDAVDLTFEDG